MDQTLQQRVVASFDQASGRGIPASEIIPRLAEKFNLRKERILECLCRAERIATAKYAGTTIVWGTMRADGCVNPNVEEQTAATLLQSGINLGLARGTLSLDYLEQTPADKVLDEFFRPLLQTAQANASSISESSAA